MSKRNPVATIVTLAALVVAGGMAGSDPIAAAAAAPEPDFFTQGPQAMPEKIGIPAEPSALAGVRQERAEHDAVRVVLGLGPARDRERRHQRHEPARRPEVMRGH